MSVPFAYLGIIVIWSTTPLAIKWSGEEVGFLLGISARIALAAAICISVFMVMRWRLPYDKQSLHVYLAVGVPAYVALGSVYLGAQYIPSGLISVMFGLTPIFTGIFAALLLKENVFTRARLFGVLLGIIGLGFIFHDSFSIGESAAFGLGMVLVATITHSFGTVWVKHVINHLSPFTVNTGGVCVAALLFGVTFLLFGKPLPVHIPEYVGLSIVYLALAGSILGAVLFYYALRHVQATSMAMLTLITPVTALFIGKWFNQETIDPFALAGTMLILLGLAFYQWGPYAGKLLRQKFL